MDFFIIATVIVIGTALVKHFYKIYNKNLSVKRTIYINQFHFPLALKDKVLNRYPHLNEQQLAMVMRGLRDYFQICNLAANKSVAMPSQVIDEAWHQFILYTKQYQEFCDHALGKFLHHTPAEAMQSPTSAQKGIKRAWRLACHHENISISFPKRLPLIFAIDTELNIKGGFHYNLDCQSTNNKLNQQTNTPAYCVTHISCTSGCSGSSHSATNSNSSFFDCSGSGCTSGCGGD